MLYLGRNEPKAYSKTKRMLRTIATYAEYSMNNKRSAIYEMVSLPADNDRIVYTLCPCVVHRQDTQPPPPRTTRFIHYRHDRDKVDRAHPVSIKDKAYTR